MKESYHRKWYNTMIAQYTWPVDYSLTAERGFWMPDDCEDVEMRCCICEENNETLLSCSKCGVIICGECCEWDEEEDCICPDCTSKNCRMSIHYHFKDRTHVKPLYATDEARLAAFEKQI